MSDFDDLMADVNDKVLDTFGDAITYTPYGGEGVSINAVLGDIDCTDVIDETGRYNQFFADLLLLLDPAAGIANPAVGDTITINTVTWYVDDILHQDGTAANLRIRRDVEVKKHSESQYKRT